MPISLGTIATGTKIASGIASLFGGKSKGVDPSVATARSIDGAVRMADKFGLHRLATLGHSASYSSPTAATGGGAEGLAQIGSALDQHQQGKTNKALEEKEGQLLDAQIAESRSRTLLNASNSRRLIYGPQNNPTGIAGGPELLKGKDPGTLGTDRGTRREPTPDMPARQDVSLGNQTATGPNPEAFEVGLSELLAGALIYGPQWIYGAMKDAAPDGPQRKQPRRGKSGTPRPTRKTTGSRRRKKP